MMTRLIIMTIMIAFKILIKFRSKFFFSSHHIYHARHIMHRTKSIGPIVSFSKAIPAAFFPWTTNAILPSNP